MLAPYIAALVVGGGVMVAQLAFGHDTDMSHDVSAGHDADHDAAWMVVLSARFWSFALLAGGLTGSLITIFSLAAPTHAAVISALMGTASGAFATTVIKRLRTRVTTSHASAADAVGKVGRVLVPPAGEAHGKVRVVIKGSAIDFVARSSEAIDEGSDVVVVEQEGDRLVVAPAPREIAK